jgi:hypothetical protein
MEKDNAIHHIHNIASKIQKNLLGIINNDVAITRKIMLKCEIGSSIF